MSKRFKCSRTALIAAGVALLALMVALGLHVSTIHSSDLRRNENKAVEGALLSEIAARNRFDSKTLKVLEANMSRFRNRFGDAGAWANLSAEFNEDWSREVGKEDDAGGYVIRQYTLRKVSPNAADWPGILKAIKRVENRVM